MDDVRYKNLYDALTSHIDYCNFIETYGEDDVNFNNTNFDLLKVIYGSFELTQLMDDYFIKSDNTVKCTLMPGFVQYLVSKIASYNGRGYTLGNVEYCDEYTVMEKFRNKLAHGDFIIRDGEIIFEENNVEGRVSVSKFMNFVCSFGNEAKANTLNLPYKKSFNKLANKNYLKKISNEKTMDNVCDDICILKFIDEPIFPKVRDCDYVINRDNFYKAVEEKLNKLSLPVLERFIMQRISILNNQGINIKYSRQSVKELDYYQNIKDRYFGMNDVYSELSLSGQIDRIINLALVLGNGQYQKFDIMAGLHLNFYTMQLLKEYPEYTLTEIITKNNKACNLYLYHLNSIILSSYLVGFVAAYDYGLEKGLTQKGSYNLVSIFEGKSLDFSKLEIDALDDPNMLIEHTFNKYLTDVAEYENKYISNINMSIEVATKKLKQYTENCRNQEQDRIIKFQTEIEQLNLMKEELETNIERLKNFEEKFDLDKYTRNINIITHIRNAVAHGNVFVDSYENDIRETDIILRDYLNDEIVYEKKIKVKDFVMLFRIDNVHNIYNFIKNNIQDKTMLDEDNYQKAVVRTFSRNYVDKIID